VSDNIVDFPKHHQPTDLAEPAETTNRSLNTIIELEHEVFELRMTIAEMAVELFRPRGGN
jgi:hypothetical protein